MNLNQTSLLTGILEIIVIRDPKNVLTRYDDGKS